MGVGAMADAVLDRNHNARRSGSRPRDSDRRRVEILFHRYREYRDEAAREELFQRFMPLAQRLARRYGRGSEPLEDLVQVACVGLVNAIDRFDAERGRSFTAFAVPTILGELKRYFRDSCWALHVPRGMQERVLEMNHAVESLSRELGQSPSPRQLADALGMTTEEVLETLEAGAAFNTRSLDAPAGPFDDDRRDLLGSLGETDGRFEMVEYGAVLGRALRALPERERRILALRFATGLTQAEIAKQVGISQMHVSRLIRRSLERLRVVVEARR
jgi:RNA polymerase sigma-B factor